MNLSPHFALSELTISSQYPEIPNQPDNIILARLETLAWRMELVREILGNQPIHVSSGYRSKALNEAIKGSKNSAHMEGRAVDFTCPKYGNPSSIVAAIRPHIMELGLDQVILEKPASTNGGWVHLGLREFQHARFQCLIFNGETYEVSV